MKKINSVILREKITSRAENDLTQNNIAGACVLVAQSGEILFEECFGYSDAEKKTPLKKDSLFRLASMTKPISAAAILAAEERGYFSLDDPVGKYFPEFLNMKVGRLEQGRVMPDRRAKREPILKDFLTHTSGFMCSSKLLSPQTESIPASAYDSLEGMVNYCLKNTCLTFEPCQSVGYAPHIPFDLLALLIERKSGVKYADFVNETVLSPLKLQNITYYPTDEAWGNLVKMCDRKSPEKMVNIELGRHTFEAFPLSYTSAGTGLIGNAFEYFVFAEMLRRGGEYEGIRILSEDSVKKLCTVHVGEELIGKNSTSGWGLSVMVRRRGYPHLEEGSYGWSGAYGTHFFIDPKNEIVGIYLKNTRWYDSLGPGNTGRHFEADVSSSLE